jgi:hypothetical protein
MNRTVNRKYIDDWVDANGPDGIAKLALKAKVSSSMVQKARLGLAFKTEYRRRLLADAIGVKEELLFPVVQNGEEAS